MSAEDTDKEGFYRLTGMFQLKGNDKGFTMTVDGPYLKQLIKTAIAADKQRQDKKGLQLTFWDNRPVDGNRPHGALKYRVSDMNAPQEGGGSRPQRGDAYPSQGQGGGWKPSGQSRKPRPIPVEDAYDPDGEYA